MVSSLHLVGYLQQQQASRMPQAHNATTMQYVQIKQRKCAKIY